MPRAERSQIGQQEHHAPIELPEDAQPNTAASRLLSGGLRPRGLVPRLLSGEAVRSPGQRESSIRELSQLSFSGEEIPVGEGLSPNLLHAGLTQQAPESGLLAVSQPQEAIEPTLFAGRTTIPEDIVPENHHIVMDHATGLAIVSQVTRHSVAAFDAEAMPKEDKRAGIVLPTQKDHMSLVAWLSNPDGALWGLAKQSQNDDALDLVEAAKTERQLRQKALDRDNDIETTVRALGELSSHTARRLPQQDFTRHERIALAGKESAYPTDMPQATLKLLLSETLAEEFPKEDYTKEQKIAKHKAMDAFFSAVLEDTEELIGTSGETHVISRLSHLADLHRLQTKSMQIPGYKTVETATKLLINKDALTPTMIEFLTRFEIPPSLGGEILSYMEHAGQLTHPLALHLMDHLPKDHPFKQQQRDRVNRLTTLVTGDISPEDLYEAMQLRDRIVSVYVDPDSDPQRDKVGLEFENFPLITGISVPQGTTMGQDGDDFQNIPELRLNDETEVLMYGTSWRERYFNLLLWAQLTKTEQRSLHLHVNRNDKTRPELYKLLFGFDYDLVKENSLGTMEVRSTLKDYKKGDVKEEGVVGFSSFYMPELVDLIYSLRSVSFTPVNLSDMQKDRFGFFTTAVSDPLSRAAMLIALRGEAGQRVLNPVKTHDYIAADNFTGGAFKIDGTFNAFTYASQKKLLTSVLDLDNPALNLHIAYYLGSLDASFHSKVVTKLLASGNKQVILGLTTNISALQDISLQNQVAGMVLAKGDVNAACIRSLANHIGKLEDPTMQTRVAKYILDNTPEIAELLIESTGSLEPQMQRDVIDYTLNKPVTTTLRQLGEILHTLDPEVLEEFVAETFKKKDRQRIVILGSYIGSLDISYQKRFVTWLEEEKTSEGIFLLANAVDKIDKSVQVRAAKLALGVDNGALDEIIKHMDIFNEPMQQDIITTTYKCNRTGSLALLGQHISKIAPSLHTKIIATIIDTNNPGIKYLASSLDAIDKTAHKKIADATFATKNATTIRSLLDHIDAADITIQKRYVDWVISQRSVDEMLYSGVAIGLFDPSLQERLITHAQGTGAISFFEEIASRIGSVDPALHNQVAINIVLDGNERILFPLGHNFHLLSASARATATPYLEDFYPRLYRAASMNVPEWHYPNAT